MDSHVRGSTVAWEEVADWGVGDRDGSRTVPTEDRASCAGSLGNEILRGVSE